MGTFVPSRSSRAPRKGSRAPFWGKSGLSTLMFGISVALCLIGIRVLRHPRHAYFFMLCLIGCEELWYPMLRLMRHHAYQNTEEIFFVLNREKGKKRRKEKVLSHPVGAASERLLQPRRIFPVRTAPRGIASAYNLLFFFLQVASGKGGFSFILLLCFLLLLDRPPF